MFRIMLMTAAVMLGLSATPTMTPVGDLSVPGIALGGSAAMAQRTMSDPRYQPGSGSCRDGAGRRC